MRSGSARARASSLIIRQPAVIGVPLTTFNCGAAAVMPSAHTNFIVSSTPTVPVASPRSFSPCGDECVWAFVFIPGAHVGDAVGKRAERDLFPRAVLFERRADEERLPLDRDDRTRTAVRRLPIGCSVK